MLVGQTWNTENDSIKLVDVDWHLFYAPNFDPYSKSIALQSHDHAHICTTDDVILRLHIHFQKQCFNIDLKSPPLASSLITHLFLWSFFKMFFKSLTAFWLVGTGYNVVLWLDMTTEGGLSKGRRSDSFSSWSSKTAMAARLSFFNREGACRLLRFTCRQSRDRGG